MTTISDKKTAFRKVYNTVVAVLGALFLLYFVCCGISLRFTVSALWIWLLLGIYCLAKGMISLDFIKRGIKPSKALRVLWIVWLVIVYIMIFLFVVFECFALKDAFTPPKEGLNYLIVLGAKVDGEEPSPALRTRIEAAGEYLLSHPDCRAILTGGKGRDEGISEAECMHRKLILMGIDEERLIIEDKSTSTLENIKYSYDFLPDGEQKVGIVSSNYHIFRAKAFFKRVFGYEASGVPAKPDNLFWQPHNFTREFVAYVADFIGVADELSAISHPTNVALD